MVPPSAHVLLVVDAVQLVIPVAVIHNVCFWPVKYLRYVGYCVAGALGVIQLGGEVVADDGVLEEEKLALSPSIKSPTPTLSTLRAQLTSRDGRCVFSSTQLPDIAFLAPNKTTDPTAANTLSVSPSIRALLNASKFGVIKTPNAILDSTDVRPAPPRSLPPEMRFPADARYHLHWLVEH
ncbi:ER-Golgi vesicle protein transport Sft2 [Mycena indigotica]|uniref:ER-Golgi vesicle protein transport Sft2 n=1 Tax=Mycena indigotica TaxID=2126181 RepID=A0A8H6T2J9_9AGAR|nr:ER-Golgi vesicle protein transport Sft2 [Mycena indigotica]KAF7309861.1 ER-Golgi vesicle protein transport Sft2 [Mycena indigotica]